MLHTIVRMPIKQRLFADWAMAFRAGDELPPDIRDQISSFLDDAVCADASAGCLRQAPALGLLSRFATTMR
ncbi:MAG TPA: hypothetical protein VHW90_12890 [Stellaceae bacterium]|nr:hypothetical protein [Stellaceae bacterium]